MTNGGATPSAPVQEIVKRGVDTTPIAHTVGVASGPYPPDHSGQASTERCLVECCGQQMIASYAGKSALQRVAAVIRPSSEKMSKQVGSHHPTAFHQAPLKRLDKPVPSGDSVDRCRNGGLYAQPPAASGGPCRDKAAVLPITQERLDRGPLRAGC